MATMDDDLEINFKLLSATFHELFVSSARHYFTFDKNSSH